MKTLLYLNLIFSCGILALFIMGFQEKQAFKTIEAQNITLKSPDSQAFIHLGFAENKPFFVLGDATGKPRVQMESDGIFLKNTLNKTISSWTLLTDGGAGLGLADKEGVAASIIRGGDNPSVAFFSNQNEPMAALGVMKKVPHMLISGPLGSEGILIHGGKPSSMIVIDESGKVKILISKHGVFQGKDESSAPFQKKDKKFFSLEDKHRLFPDLEEGGIKEDVAR